MDFKFENLAKIDEILLKMDILEQKISGAKKWLNVSETAHYLGYSKDYIHKLKDTYFLENKHFYKKAGRLLFDKDELDIWVKSSNNKIDAREIANKIMKGLI